MCIRDSFFTVYGPWGRPDMAPCLFMKAILNGDPIKVFNNGQMRRDFTSVSYTHLQAILKDHFNAITNIDESRLNDVSRVVESYSGIVILANKPIVGENVFTQVAGVHADGDNKSNLYCNCLLYTSRCV